MLSIVCICQVHKGYALEDKQSHVFCSCKNSSSLRVSSVLGVQLPIASVRIRKAHLEGHPSAPKCHLHQMETDKELVNGLMRDCKKAEEQVLVLTERVKALEKENRTLTKKNQILVHKVR